MAPTIEGQIELRGVLMGPGTPYRVQRFSAWRRGVRANDTDRSWAHGTISGAEWRSQIVVDIDLHYGAATHADWVDLNDAATEAFAPVGDDVADQELRFFRGGREYLYFGRPRVFEPETRPGQRRSNTVATFVTTSKPFRFSGDLQTAGPVTLPRFIGGMAFPQLLPHLIESTRVGGQVTIINDGNADAHLLVRIDGPVIEPRISLQRPDGIIQTVTWHDLAIPAGQFLLADTDARTAFLGGLETASQHPGFAQWPVAPKGTSELRFDAADRNEEALLTATWRHTWW